MTTWFEVQTWTLCEGWVNTWTTWDGDNVHDEMPTTFFTQEAAQEALDEYLADIKQAVADGDMAEEYNPEDFRIVKAFAGVDYAGTVTIKQEVVAWPANPRTS